MMIPLILLLYTHYTHSSVCPSSLVSFIEEGTGRHRSCSKSQICPRGYSCIDRICCGLPGKCPNPYSILYMVDGSPRSCTSSISCSRSSRCLPSTMISQSLCCTLLDCPNPTIPSNEKIQLCDSSSDCPQGSQCIQSSTSSLIKLCCYSPSRPSQSISSNRNICPLGWIPYGSSITACSLSGNYGDCPRGSSCLSSSIMDGDMYCCTPGRTVSSSLSTSRCPDGKSSEIQNGEPRSCSIQKPICSRGFTCERTGLSSFLCCPSSNGVIAQQASFTCPGVGQTPSTSSTGGNLFCSQVGIRDTCPQHALCQSAANSLGMFICCYSDNEVTPSCPNNGIPQPSITGYTSCDISQPTNQCDQGYSCVRAANDFNTAMCCSSTTNEQSICPNQAKLLMESSNPVSCNPNQIGSCPSGYSCQLAIGTDRTYVCCSSSTCPSTFTPSLDPDGSSIHCSPNEPAGCPEGSSCLQTMQSDDLYICCRSTISSRVCPNNQNALVTSTGSLETCTGPGTPCSKTGYTCQFSTVLAGWLCCGVDSSIARCADGSETYEQVAGETYSCSVLTFPSNCPSGYTCSSSSISGLNVCCKQSMNTSSLCPIGWNPYRNEVTKTTRSCSSAIDESCPTGYSCTPIVSSVTSITSFTCCRLADSPRCPSSTTYLLNSQPRLCSSSRLNQCPIGYQCTTSTVPSVSICCSSSTSTSITNSIVCPDGSSPFTFNNNLRYCPIVGTRDSCPTGYICISISSLQVCCRRSVHHSHSKRRLKSPSFPISSSIKISPCGIGAEPLIHNNSTVHCHNQHDICPISHPCRTSSLTGNSFCCQEAQCPNGVRVGPKPTLCTSTNDCSATAICVKATNIDELKICCAIEPEEDIRCLGRGTQLRGGRPVSCLIGSICGSPFVCSILTSNGSSICCEKEEEAILTCPQSRLPLRSDRSDEIIYCGRRRKSKDGRECKEGYECIHPNESNRPSICCSSIPKCPNGRPAMVGSNNQIKRCFMSQSNDECQEGFECSETSVYDLFACCLSPSSKYISNSSLISPIKSIPITDNFVQIEAMN